MKKIINILLISALSTLCFGQADLIRTKAVATSDTIFNKGLTENGDYSANKTEFSYITLKMLDDKTSLTSPDGSIWDIQNDGTFVKRI